MKKHLLQLKNAFFLIGNMLHEMSHILMALLLYPFGARLNGVKIVCGFNSDGHIVFEGHVYTQSNKACLFFISLAPVLFFLTIAVLFLIKLNIIIYGVWWCFFGRMMPSKEDVDNMKSCFNKADAKIIKGDKLTQVLNSCLDKNFAE